MKINEEIAINRPVVFHKQVSGIGTFYLHPFDPDMDAAVIHDWVSQEYARFWGMQRMSAYEVRQEYAQICAGHTQVFIGVLNGEPCFLVEKYWPAHDPVARFYDVQKGDRGMHLLMAPPRQYIHGYSREVFGMVMEFLFHDEDVQRVVVEPDIANKKIHIRNRSVGFAYQYPVELPGKTGYLAFCTRQQFEAACQANLSNKQDQWGCEEELQKTPEHASTHLNEAHWRETNRYLVRKAIAEFAHELLLSPKALNQQDGGDWWELCAEKTDVTYRFKAQKLSLDHWSIDELSIARKVRGQHLPLDALAFIWEFKEALGIPEEKLPVYLEEITSTLYGRCFMLDKPELGVADMLSADYQAIEHAMTAGHPCFVANNGRIGFDANDYKQYAPEANHAFRLIWLAGHHSRAHYSGVEGYAYQDFMQSELGVQQVKMFNHILEKRGLEPSEYIFIPVHPWQWHNKLASVFAPDLAAGKLVYLGEGADHYLAQQSIRTMFNRDNPQKHYVKTALSILNMGFMRGLSPYYMESTPAITEWVSQLLGQEAYLKQCGFMMLNEVATVGYRNAYFEPLGKTNAYNKMLAALWRESPIGKLQGDQQLMTMAALLHVDRDGKAFLPAVIAASGRSAQEWLKAYLDCYLKPLLHCFYKYDIVFMPHGENLILVLENHLPVSAIMKDITEEMLVLSPEVALPEKVQRLYAPTPEDIRLLSIFTDIFDCFFRFLVASLVEHNVLKEVHFWKLVARCIREYQKEHPELADKFKQYDLFVPQFTRSCLNRLQLKDNQQMINLADPVGALQFVGVLDNPIAPYADMEV